METKQQLIIIADDYGYSNERDDGIIQCYKTGAITGVSLMVNGYSAERAVKNALCVGLPIGKFSFLCNFDFCLLQNEKLPWVRILHFWLLWSALYQLLPFSK